MTLTKSAGMVILLIISVGCAWQVTAPPATDKPTATRESSKVEIGPSTKAAVVPAATHTPTLTPSPAPTATPAPTPTAAWAKLLDATSVQAWPNWCVTSGANGKPAVKLLPLQVENFCFNEASTRVLANFAIEWTVRIKNGSALLLFGENNRFYQISITPGQRQINLQKVENFAGGRRQDLGTIPLTALNLDDGAANTIRITRLDSTLTVWVNGKQVRQFTDTLFGDHTPVAVGVGAATHTETGATVYLDILNVYVPDN